MERLDLDSKTTYVLEKLSDNLNMSINKGGTRTGNVLFDQVEVGNSLIIICDDTVDPKNKNMITSIVQSITQDGDVILFDTLNSKYKLTKKEA